MVLYHEAGPVPHQPIRTTRTVGSVYTLAFSVALGNYFRYNHDIGELRNVYCGPSQPHMG
jgi:hypothetical protein